MKRLVRIILSASHCYHPDCGGKPIQFCPYGGSHPR